MTLSERAAYLKGLKEGLKLNTETSEGKLLNEIIEMLEDVALSVNDLEDCTSAISDELDLIEEEIEEIEDYLDEDDECCCCADDDDDEDDEIIYEVKCPTCDEVINLDAHMLEMGGIKCPNCGEELEFDAIDDEEE